MTIFAGVFSLDASREIPAVVASDLSNAISRNVADNPNIYRGAGYAAACLELQLLRGEGTVADQGGAFTFLAGDPLLTPRSEASRTDDLMDMHASWLKNDNSLLARARGSYCAVQVDPAAGKLRLATDKLGTRPLYVSFSDGLVYFSTALRILEAISSLTRRLDVRGLIETAAFGYPLATRTQYEGIEVLDGGEFIEVSRETGVQRRRYWTWSGLVDAGYTPDKLSETLYTTFRDAVRWRLGRERSVLAFLSGGLDSRCVAACLLAEGARVHSVNLAPEGTLDLHFARLAAERMGARHFEYPRGPFDVMDLTVEGHAAWLAATPHSEQPDLTAAAWTGTGGSVGVGNVYLNDSMIALMRQGRRIDAVMMFLQVNRIGASVRIFRKEFWHAVKGFPLMGMLDEVQKYESFDEGRSLHLFLMMNDQRRHLARLYEDIDRIRLEYINPFFDSEFVRVVLSSPVDAFMEHRLYNRWLKEFPFAIDGVPWQAYPGHEPCHLPMPRGLRNQWDDGWSSEESAKQFSARLLREASEALSSPHFPSRLLSKPALWLAWWLTSVGISDYSYLLKTACIFSRRAERSGSTTPL